MKNPFITFSKVPTSKELLDIAFKKGMKSSAQVSHNAPILIKAKKKEARRIKTTIKIFIEKIQSIIKRIPIIPELPDFYRELAALLVDVDELRLTLGKIYGILPILNKIERNALRDLKKIEAPKDADRIRRSVFGRASDIINRQNKNLEYLNSIRVRLRKIPAIDYTMPCVVVAGYPNVGKSSIVREISTAKSLNVAEYPFTTKEISIGHLEIEERFGKKIVQIFDTPGILDRPMAKRNSIELQAILALRLISDIILFVFDPTPSSGYSVDSQIKLFDEIKQNFSKNGEVKIIIIFNKEDLTNLSEIDYLKKTLRLKDDEYFITNALTGKNMDKITSCIIEGIL